MDQKKYFRIRAITLMAILVCNIFLSCQKGDLQGPYKFGAILPLTGRAAMLGENVRNGMQMAVDDINSSGGINGRLIEVEFGDSKDDPKEGVSLMNRYTSINNYPIVVSAMTSITSPLIPIADRTGTVLFATMVSSPTYAEKSEYLFRCFTRAGTEVPPLAKIAYDQLEMRKIASIYVDDDFGKGYMERFKADFESLGGTFVGDLPFTRGSSDFRNTITKLQIIDEDGIYVVGYDRAMGLIPKQIRELGINSPILANASAATPAYISIAGEAAEGITLMNFAFSTRAPRTEEGKQLVTKYEELFGKTPLVLTVIGYDIVKLLAVAIESKGFNAKDVKQGLLEINNHDGVIGKLSVQSTGEVDVPLMPLVIQGGRPAPFNVPSSE